MASLADIIDVEVEEDVQVVRVAAGGRPRQGQRRARAENAQPPPQPAPPASALPPGQVRRYIAVTYSEPHVASIAEAFEEGAACQIGYFVGQLERCPSTGRPHWQCYVEFSARQRATAIRHIMNLPVEPHVEVAKGTPDENIRYCTKPDTRIVEGGGWQFQIGQPRRAEARNRGDLGLMSEKVNHEALIEAVNDGAQVDELLPLLGRSVLLPGRVAAIEQLCNRRKLEERTSVVTFYLWGGQGVGKTTLALRKAKLVAGEDGWFLQNQGMGKWFDGYLPDRHRVIIFDEAAMPEKRSSADHLSILDWLSICQHVPQRLQVKGGSTRANWSMVIITTNKSLDAWLANIDDETQKLAFKSRLGDRVQHMVGEDRRRTAVDNLPKRLEDFEKEHFEAIGSRAAAGAPPPLVHNAPPPLLALPAAPPLALASQQQQQQQQSAPPQPAAHNQFLHQRAPTIDDFRNDLANLNLREESDEYYY